jgi:hypothetical protein
MKYAAEMGSDSMTYIPSFIETGSDIQKLIVGEGIHRHTVCMGIAQAYFRKAG